MKIDHYIGTSPVGLIGSIIQMDQSYFKYSWTEFHWNDLSENTLLSVLHIDGQLVAFSLFNLNIFEELGHLLKVCVHPKFRGQGLSTKILTEAIEEIKNIEICRFYLEVEVENATAIGLYGKLGFSALNTINGFYSDGANALAMILE